MLRRTSSSRRAPAEGAGEPWAIAAKMPGALSADQNCNMADRRRNGDRSAFEIVCGGNGNCEHNGDDYRGTMQMTAGTSP